MLPRRLLRALSFLSTIYPALSTFTFQFGAPTECDNLTITWTGGQAPFQMLLVPVFGTPRNITIPDSAYSNGKGTLQTQIAVAATKQFLIVMSDATGFSTGGVSDLATVGTSLSGGGCNTTYPAVPYSFILDTALTQCREYKIYGWTGATQPVTIVGYIPGGDTFTIVPPRGTSYQWIPQIPQGTSLIMSMFDAKGVTGGSSDIKISGASDDTSCLSSGTVYSSTSNAPSASSTASQDNSSTTKNSTTIALGVVGAIVALGLVAALIIFFVRRRIQARRGTSGLYDTGGGPFRGGRRGSKRIRSIVDLGDHQESIHGHIEPSNAPRVTPFSYQATSTDHLSAHSNVDLHAPYTATSPTTTPNTLGGLLPENTSMGRSSKAREAGVRDINQPRRYIVHTDVEDAVPPDADDDIVELPPTYTERRRGPPSGYEDSTDGTAGSSVHPSYRSPHSDYSSRS